MNTQTKIYIAIALAALTIVAFIFSSLWTTRKFTNLERELERAKHSVTAADKIAAQKELEAAEYKQKLEYLEQNLSEIKAIARKQDENLEKLNTNSRDARRNVERLRRTRPTAVTDSELCAKLAEIGHGC